MEENKPSSVTPADSIRQLTEKIQNESPLIDMINKELSSVIVGQDRMLVRLLIALLADGHILLEGVPGLAKTLAINTLADVVGGEFSRIQFTPDLLPADVTGTQIYNQRTQEFSVIKGPIFANFILADEINRAPAKVQSALLEAMQERQITIGDETFKLPKPFLVMATQNPIEQEGTYPLPEAQVDRFMLKVRLEYPNPEEEMQILRSNVRKEGLNKAKAVVSPNDIVRLRDLVREVYLDEKIEKYIIDIVFATRDPEKFDLTNLTPLISFGASPRASINLALAGKANAFLQGRAYVIPEDIRSIAVDVIQHRLGLTYEAEAEGVDAKAIVEKVLARVEVP
ncbi:AAA family ATPase [Brumimicrobium mesophilum]|uniref:AAA family ATPase n=1 Tax=Brumimicrobium mesophilum TaxID=392717 RepID=UPI000D144E1E|nr:MoxR family ATPase [Brumimicrobium mesophilum]